MSLPESAEIKPIGTVTSVIQQLSEFTDPPASFLRNTGSPLGLHDRRHCDIRWDA